MNIEEQKKYYDKLWTHSKLNSLNLKRFIKILQLFEVPKKKFKQPKILDLGCGDGRLASLLGQFGTAEGLELSEKAVEQAKVLYPHVNYFQGNALEYPLTPDYYDLVVSQEVIEHIWDQEKYIEVCFKALKKDGYLILTTPNKNVLDNMARGKEWSNQPIENLISPSNLKKMISKRFDIIEFDSIILNFGDLGKYKIINSRYIIGICNKLGLKMARERLLGRWGYGLHQCILAKRR